MRKHVFRNGPGRSRSKKLDCYTLDTFKLVSKVLRIPKFRSFFIDEAVAFRLCACFSFWICGYSHIH